MGQRLVIEIHQNKQEEKVVATVYYHWSGYTVSSLWRARQLFEALEHPVIREIPDVRLRLIRACEENGGGLDPDEDYGMFPGQVLSEDVDRNDGLVAITEKEQKVHQNHSEADMVIYLDEREVGSSVYWAYDSPSAIEDEELTEDDFVEIHYDLDSLNADDIQGCINELSTSTFFRMNGLYCIQWE